MALRTYRTLDDLNAIVNDQIQEGLSLEYKGSAILGGKDSSAIICKGISAFANSIGGTFIIGIESHDFIPVRIDEGTKGKSKRDWIYNVINDGTFPAIENVEVHEFQTSTGTIYSIEVPASLQAPHQSKDRKYYKRRGTHSDVMEHYEIEDVRNRPKRQALPLRAELYLERGVLAHLRLKNDHEIDPVTSVRCQIEANFPLDRTQTQTLADRGVRALWPNSNLHFLLGSMFEILQYPEPILTLRFKYEFNERSLSQSITLYFADLEKSSIIETPIERRLETLGTTFDKVIAQLERLNRNAETLAQMVDGTGLRISQRTLRKLKDIPQLFDPREFQPVGYSIVADISIAEAHSLHNIFNSLNVVSSAEQRYQKISPSVRLKFEKYFNVNFS
jgi:hypothetical protein